MKRKRVCIDINYTLPVFSQGYLTGIGRTALELILELEKLKSSLPFDIVMYSQNTKNITSKSFGLTFQSKHIPLPYREMINYILSIAPVRTKYTQADLWHCPHNADFVDDESKTVFTLHDMIVYRCRNEFPEEVKEKVYKALPPLMQKAKGIITCSHSSKNDIVDLLHVNPDKIKVIPWGVRHDLFHQRMFSTEERTAFLQKTGLPGKYFLSVSCGYGRKNTISLIKSYLKFLHNHPENDLVLVWNNYRKDIPELEDSRYKERIHILKAVDDMDLAYLYNLATVTFFISEYEGFGLPVLESMASGTPVVTSPNSSLLELGSDVAFFVEPKDEDAITAQMEYFENHDDNKNVIDKGIIHASSYTWRKCAEQTIQYYNQLLNT